MPSGPQLPSEYGRRHAVSEWETFCDKSYYHLWRVRRKNERGFNDGYHIHNGEEARDLVEIMNGLERDIAGWETKWKCAVEMAAIAENERDMLRSLLTHNEIERDELKEQLDFERELNKHKAIADAIGIGEAVGESVKDRIDALQEQLDAAIMLGKMQERRHERELEELIAAAKAVIDRWETPFWKETAHTGAYIAALRKAVEIAEGGHL